ncbi:MAG: hypothetical protein JSS68_15025 [Actinobacteria bacterium]|nr:hypothetical protein [Actinomycetota bacterium]
MPFPVTKDRALRLDEPAEAERFVLLNANGGDTIYYSASPSVTPMSNEGSVAPGSTLELTVPKYVISAGHSVAHLIEKVEVRTGLTGPELATKEELSGSSLGSESVQTSNIKASAVTEPKLGSEAVTAAKLHSNAVETAKIKTEAVTKEKLSSSVQSELGGSGVGPEGITTEKLAASAVTGPKLAAESVEQSAIKAGAVTEGKLGAESVPSSAIKSSAVTAGKIASNAVTEAKIEAGAVTEGKLGVGSVAESKLASSAVTAAKLASNAVETAKVASGAITEEKLASAVKTKLAEGGEAKTSLSSHGMGAVVAGTKTTARPSGFDCVTWVQKEEPEHAAEGDVWIES